MTSRAARNPGCVRPVSLKPNDLVASIFPCLNTLQEEGARSHSIDQKESFARDSVSRKSRLDQQIPHFVLVTLKKRRHRV